MYLRRRLRVREAGDRRNTFLKYLGEIAEAVGDIQDYEDNDKAALYERLCAVAKAKTLHADMRVDEHGNFVGEETQDFGDNVLIVEQQPATGETVQ
jgi:DNA topoisomerase VI subunit B